MIKDTAKDLNNGLTKMSIMEIGKMTKKRAKGHSFFPKCKKKLFANGKKTCKPVSDKKLT